MVGQQGHGIYNPNGAMVGQQGHGIYNPNGAMVGQQGHGIYNPNAHNPNGAMVGQQGHGIYNPNAAMVGQNGQGTFNPNGYNPNGMVGQQGHGIYNPNGANGFTTGHNGHGINPNVGMPAQNGGGAYNANGFATGHNGHGINPNVGMPGQNGGGAYNANGFSTGHNGHGIYNPNAGMMPGQNGGGMRPVMPGQNGGGMRPVMPGQSGGGVYNPNAAQQQQLAQQQQYSCPLQGQYLAGHAAADSRVRSMERAQQRCNELAFACAGITCHDAARCTVRASRTLMQSSSGEFSLMKGEPCTAAQAGAQAGSQAGSEAITQAMMQAGLWPQHLEDNTRCTMGEEVVRVSGRMECQEKALSEHKPFYHFRDDNNKCGVSMTCDSPRTGTRRPWRVYALPMWPQHLADNTRCTRGGIVDVGNMVECQQRAVSLGHPFYHFRLAGADGTEGKCGTAESCDSPLRGTNQIWRVYRNPLITVSPTSFQGSR